MIQGATHLGAPFSLLAVLVIVAESVIVVAESVIVVVIKSIVHGRNALARLV